MVNSFAELKKNRSTSIASLSKELEKFSTKTAKKEDTRFWQPEVDKSGNGYAVIRFLPEPKGNDEPKLVQIWNHGFQGPGGWYIENSLTTIGQPDPVSELNSKLWNSGNEKDKEIARKQKRRLTYIANILVVKDPSNPQNEGKVFLYKFGKKIFEKIKAANNPEFEDEKPMNPFDLFDGANFKLKIRNFEGYRNYDKSEFDSPSPVSDDEDELEKIWDSEFSLKEFLAPSNFKTYDELKARLDRVLGVETTSQRIQREEAEVDDYVNVKRVESPSVGKVAKAAHIPAASDDEEDDDLAFFKKLSEDDE